MWGRVWKTAFDVAVDQHGYVTFDDLRRLGADPALLRQWRQRGRVERAAHGIYRFPQIPATPHDPLMLATLWPAGRGVLSHETALEAHELCDVNPAKIHITLPPNYRPRRRGGEQYVVHHDRLDNADVTWYEGIRIVTPAVAIRQAIESKLPRQLVRQALETAKKRGSVPRPILIKLLERAAA
ncbi:type IV toxin-antitoxin system AbiEi family antitoxin domain-containing protein [Myxococcota bacterium]